MELAVQGPGPGTPFLRAKDRFETEYDLELPVRVRVREDPGERTWVGHEESRHMLNISQRATNSAMAAQLALHEFAHMRRHEEGHPSHVQSTEEALFLAFADRSIERSTLAHCYQIANHAKDVYADDITLSVSPSDHLAAFLESELAGAVAEQATTVPGSRFPTRSEPSITAVNAAFAIALLERHEAVSTDHPIYDLAHAAAEDAPAVDLPTFRERFRSLSHDPSESEYRRKLLDLLRPYVDARASTQAVGD